MNQRRFVTLAVALGAAIPVVWLIAYWVFLRGNSALVNSIMSEEHLRVISIIWPSWLLLMADPEERGLTIPAVSIAINALLYGIVGWLIWFGLNRKNRLILTAVAATLIICWYVLLRWLYFGG